ncbi:MAG: hypothetical protein FJ304_27150 [Planctomycetes bacterium]|nr:hypothetical protein [Planctomycetota bacterium]
MRAALPALAVAGLFAVLAPAVQPDPKLDPKPANDAALTKQVIETDLKLVAVAPKERVIEAGTQAYIGLKLVNTSKTRAHKVVKPGDGSECGWRDPWVHVTAEQRGVDGAWTALKPRAYGRCGLFDFNWPKDTIELKPGAELELKDWYHPAGFDFQYPGTVRLVGHYEHRAVGGKNGQPRPDAERGAMAGVPLFALRTEPVEFEVVRPLDVRVKVKKVLKVGVETKASDVLEITVTNTSKVRRVVGNVATNGYGVDIALYSDLAGQLAFKDVPVYSTEKTLEPGESVVVFGGGTFASAADGPWKGLKAGSARVRVGYSIPTNSSATHVVYEPDAELKVEE